MAASKDRFLTVYRPPYIPTDPHENVTVQENEEAIEIVYEILMPIIACIGIFGNIIGFAVLRNQKFNSYMYSYMRGLAITDSMYLIFSLQASYLVSHHYFLSSNSKPCDTKALAVYVWNLMSPFWNLFACSSDLVIVCMTVDRYRIMRVIDRVNAEYRRLMRLSHKHLIVIHILSIVFVSLCFHLPYFFQFDVEPCDEEEEAMFEMTGHCWISEVSDFAGTKFWTIFSYIYEVLMKILPASVILVLNLLMLFKLKQVWAQKKQLKSSMSCHRTQTNQTVTTTVTTISELLMRAPSVLGYDVTKTSTENTKFGRFQKRFQKPPKKNRLLPNKVFGKEVRLTMLLLSIVFCHILLTLFGNITYFMWTVFPCTWDKVEGQVIWDSVADLLYTVNYSINFYLYCIANREFRTEVREMFATIYQNIRQCSIQRFNITKCKQKNFKN